MVVAVPRPRTDGMNYLLMLEKIGVSCRADTKHASLIMSHFMFQTQNACFLVVRKIENNPGSELVSSATKVKDATLNFISSHRAENTMEDSNIGTITFLNDDVKVLLLLELHGRTGLVLISECFSFKHLEHSRPSIVCLQNRKP